MAKALGGRRRRRYAFSLSGVKIDGMEGRTLLDAEAKSFPPSLPNSVPANISANVLPERGKLEAEKDVSVLKAVKRG